MKLAWKLIAAMTAATMVILGLYGYLSFRRESAIIEDSTRETLVAMGHALRPAMVKVWHTAGEQRALQVVDFADDRLTHVGVRWVELDAPAGSARAAAVPAARLTPLRRGVEVALADPLGHDRFYAYVPVSRPGLPAGALELTRSLEHEREFVRASVWSVVVTTVGVAVAAAVVILTLGALLIGRPMQQLAAQARRVAAGDFAVRLRARQRDEIGAVAREMDHMCERLEAARERVAAETAARLEALAQVRHAERLATIGRLAAGVAHEVNTPLTVISVRAALLAEGRLADGEAPETARVIHGQAKRIAAIVRQMLDFARVGSDHRQLVDAGATVNEALGLVAAEARKRKVAVAFEDGSAQARVWADRSQLQQVVTNLVVNGLHAMPDGGTLAVSLKRARRRPPGPTPAPEGESLAIAVADHGVGIPSDRLDHIFEPFYTTKGVGEGTGLGLSVVHGIVQEHGGWIEVDSAVGRGSCFTVWLPVAPPAAAPA